MQKSGMQKVGITINTWDHRGRAVNRGGRKGSHDGGLTCLGVLCISLVARIARDAGISIVRACAIGKCSGAAYRGGGRVCKTSEELFRGSAW